MTTPTHPEHPPLPGGQRLLGTLVLSLATFMNVLDASIANVSLPAISGDLGASVHQGTRVITGFGIATAISVPLTGWLTQRFGQVRLFVASIVLFVLMSWLCGQATSLEWLIAFRVVQGLVAGPMMPLSQTLLLATHPPERRGTALAISSMTVLLAPIAGPLLGGWITDNLHWPWIFYINVPIGLGCAALTWVLYRDRESPIRRLPVDVVGLVLIVLWVGALQTMLDTGKELDWFESNEIVVLALVAGIGFVLFLVWELTEEHPIVDLRLFANRNFSLGVATLAGGFALFSGNVVLLPLWLQQSMGYTATWAGLVLAPVGVVAVLVSPLAGRAIERGWARPMAVFAFASFALSFWMRSNFTTQSDYLTIMEPMIFQGLAGSTFFIAMTSINLSETPAHRMALASGLSNFVRIAAGAFGTSIASTLWDERTRHHRAHLVEDASRAGWSLDSPFFEPLRAAGAGLETLRAQLERLVDPQAQTLGANDIFLASAFLYLLLIVPVLFAHPVRGRAGPPARTRAVAGSGAGAAAPAGTTRGA
ncbi:MAG: DHA2 family efflux MFS transporter permease subunit [Burkholderiaceae bacterium]